MCEPATIAMATLALSAASAGAQVYSQTQTMHAQERANEQDYQNKMTAYRSNLTNIEVTRNQMQQDATEKINANNAAARAAEATAKTSAGESGVSGLSVDALLRDLAGEAGYDNTNVEANYLRNDTALNSKRENAYNMTASEINMMRTPTAPDYVGAGLRIANSGLSAYGEYKKQDAILRGVK